jgi:hypothetical protein
MQAIDQINISDFVYALNGANYDKVYACEVIGKRTLKTTLGDKKVIVVKCPKVLFNDDLHLQQQQNDVTVLLSYLDIAHAFYFDRFADEKNKHQCNKFKGNRFYLTPQEAQRSEFARQIWVLSRKRLYYELQIARIQGDIEKVDEKIKTWQAKKDSI